MRQIKSERHREYAKNHRKRDIKNSHRRISRLDECERLAPESGESRETTAEARDKEVLGAEPVLMISEKRRENPYEQTPKNIYEKRLNRKLTDSSRSRDETGTDVTGEASNAPTKENSETREKRHWLTEKK